MTNTTIAATQTDTIYISPYEMRRPRGRPRIPDELRKPPPPPRPPPPPPKPKIISSKGPGRPRRETPLTPEEIEERRIRYKGDLFKHEYTRLYQQCYYLRPQIKGHRIESKRKRRQAIREAKTTQ